MALLELHKHEHGIELVSELPETHIFSKRFVDAAAAEGWLEFAGDPVSYEVTPDPLGQFANASALTLTLPGDTLVLHVLRGDELVDVLYRITHYPVPQSFRLADDHEPDGIRIAPEYGLELVED